MFKFQQLKTTTSMEDFYEWFFFMKAEALTTIDFDMKLFYFKRLLGVENKFDILFLLDKFICFYSMSNESEIQR